MIFLQLTGIFLAIKVKNDIVHSLANSRIIGQHFVAQTCGRAIRKFLPHALEKGFGIGKLLRVASGLGDAAHQRRVPRHVLPLHIEVKAGQITAIISRGRVTAQAVAVMLRFHDVAIVLYIATVDFSAVVIAETLHREAVFQHIFTELTNDLLQLRFERGAVQFLRATGPPGMPELVSAAPEVHADTADSAKALIFFGVLGIK